ncbi:MAG: hypothetical protein EKK62_09610 [Acidimicrobiia bacterium]|nr:MAG: hypothetical protein EKK62_09610 [Acidimicrobiia bacterium]
MTEAKEDIELDEDAALDAELQRIMDAGMGARPDLAGESDKTVYDRIVDKRTEDKDGDAGDEEKPEKGEKKTTDPKKLERAMKALKRSGYEDDEIEALRKKLGDEKFLERGLKQHDTWSRQDAAYNELQTLKRGKDAGTAKDSTSDEGGAGVEEPVAAARKALVDNWGEGLAGGIDALLKAAIQPYLARIETLEKVSEVREREHGEQIISSVREKLAKRFQALSDGKVFSGVTERMRALGMLDSIREGAESAPELVERLMVEAARAAGLEERSRKTRDARDNGTATTPDVGGTSSPRSDRERDLAAYKYLQSHPNDIAGARRAAGYR